MELYDKYPTCAWIKKTTPERVIEGFAVVKDIKAYEPNVKTDAPIKYSKPFPGFKDVAFFRAVEGLGYYCANSKGFSKARRTFLYTIEESEIFEMNKNTKGIDRPNEYPCIVQFYLDGSSTVQIKYILNSKSLEVLKLVPPVKSNKH